MTNPDGTTKEVTYGLLPIAGRAILPGGSHHCHSFTKQLRVADL